MKKKEYHYNIMNIKNIKLINYRCFTELSLFMNERVNLLIGDNASGKTTIIHSISSILSSFFSGFSDENTRFIGLSKNDFTNIKTLYGLANEVPIKINFTFLGAESSLELHSKKSNTLKKPLEEIKNLGKKLYEELFELDKQVISLPLIAGFSTNDIHKKRKISTKKFVEYNQKPSFGYYECLQGEGFLPYWNKRLLILKESNNGEIEIFGVIKAIKRALGSDGCNIIKNVEIRTNIKKVFYISIDNRETETDTLTDGYRRLINIVTDIAFRCMLLNKGIHGENACEKTEGTVIIDEIDLHLHPTLQALVLKGLQNAFPLLQFIITSHAPMIMTSIPMDDKNKIYKLEYSPNNGYLAKEIEAYGLDASTIIQTVLGVTPRSKEVDDRLKILFGFIDSDDYIRAKEKLSEMRSEFGDILPDLSKAEAMINFLTQEDDKN